MALNIKKIKDNFGSYRRIDVFTPDTFTRKMVVVSTVFSIVAKAGETAIAQTEALNYNCIKFGELEYESIKKHKTLLESIKFHESFIKENVDYDFCKKSD